MGMQRNGAKRRATGRRGLAHLLAGSMLASLLVGVTPAPVVAQDAEVGAGGCLEKVEVDTPAEQATTFGAVTLAAGETFRADIKHWTSDRTARTWRNGFNSEVRLSPMRDDGFPGYAASSQVRGFAADGPWDADGFLEDETFTYTNPSDASTTSFVFEVSYSREPFEVSGRIEASGFSTCVSLHSPPERPTRDCVAAPTLVTNGSSVHSEPFTMEKNAYVSMRMVDERPLRYDEDGNQDPVVGADFLIRARLYGRSGPDDSWHYVRGDAHLSQKDWMRASYIGKWDISIKNRSDYTEVKIVLSKWISRGYALSTPLDVSIKGSDNVWRRTCLQSTKTTVTWDTAPSCAADDTARMQAQVTNKSGESRGYRISLTDPATGDQVHGSHFHTIATGATGTVALGGIPTGSWDLRVYEQQPDGTETLVGFRIRETFDASDCAIEDLEFVDTPEIDPPSAPVMHPAVFGEGENVASAPTVAVSQIPGVIPIGGSEAGTELCPADLDMQVAESGGNSLAISIDPTEAEKLYAEAEWREKDGFGGYGLKTRGTPVPTDSGRQRITFFDLPDSMSFAEPARNGLVTIRAYKNGPMCGSWTFSSSVGVGALKYESFTEEADEFLRQAGMIAGLPISPNPWYVGEFEHDAGRADLTGDWLPDLSEQNRAALAHWVSEDALRSLRSRFESAARRADIRYDEYLVRATPLALIAAEGNDSFRAAAQGIDPASIVTMSFSFASNALAPSEREFSIFQGNLRGAAIFAGMAALTSGVLIIEEISAGQWANSGQDVVEFFGFVANVAALAFLRSISPVSVAIAIIGFVVSIVAAIWPDDSDAPKLSDPLSVIDAKNRRKLQAEADSLNETIGDLLDIIHSRPLVYERNDARDVQYFAREDEEGNRIGHVLHRVRDDESREDFGVLIILRGIEDIDRETATFRELLDVSWESSWTWEDESVIYSAALSHGTDLFTFDSALDRLAETNRQLCVYSDDCI